MIIPYMEGITWRGTIMTLTWVKIQRCTCIMPMLLNPTYI